jgi:DNA-directed RNA polymerase subunit H (RpoH/RPB5)
MVVVLAFASMRSVFADQNEIVNPGDNLNGIVLRRFLPSIKAANPELRADQMHPGDEIVIPFVPNGQHEAVVHERDTLKGEVARLTEVAAAAARDRQVALEEATRLTKRARTLDEANAWLRKGAYGFVAALIVIVFLVLALIYIWRMLTDTRTKLQGVTAEHDKFAEDRKDITKLAKELVMQAWRGKLPNGATFSGAWEGFVKEIDAAAQQAKQAQGKVTKISTKATGGTTTKR